MKTQWDYTDLAQAYLKRPDYADGAIDALLERARLGRGARACDVGAGVAHLTLKLLERGLDVVPIEPNDEMRRLGSERTCESYPAARWLEGTGEQTGQAAGAFDLVTFGSSFNVTDRLKALAESVRILKPRGFFACMYNHRELDDPLQSRIEAAIKRHLPSYGYGTRREDQTPVIEESGLFEKVQVLEARVVHPQSQADCLEAWRSHATLQRQAGERFLAVVASIREVLEAHGTGSIEVPYTTRVWLARAR
jgi:ubiquinone/menaquinone biosynthesis C-methylase UbiE